MGDFFKSKTERHEPEVVEVADPYKQTRDNLQNWIGENMGEGKQYEGQIMSPELSDQEKRSQQYVDKFATGAMPSIWQQGSQELSKTLKGDYDPATSPYYQAVKAEAARNLQDTQKNIASNAGGANRYYSGARIKQQGDAATDTNIALNRMMGELAENERARRLQAVPMAGQFGQYEQQIPLQQANALAASGAAGRTVNDAYNQALYNEWNQATRNWPLSVAGIAGGVQQAPLYGEVGYTQSPSMFSQVMSPMMQGIGSGIGQGVGGWLGNGMNFSGGGNTGAETIASSGNSGFQTPSIKRG